MTSGTRKGVRGFFRAGARAGLAGLILGLALLAGPGLRAGTVYQYRDAAGGLHFVSNLDDVPARYRGAAREVDAELSVVSPENADAPVKDRIAAVGRGLPRESSPALSLAGAVAGELWRSRLGFSLAGATAVALLIPAALWLARDFRDRQRRRNYSLLVVMTGIACLFFLWQSLAGPQALVFARAMKDWTGESLKRKDLDSKQAQKYRRLQDAAARWENGVRRSLLGRR